MRAVDSINLIMEELGAVSAEASRYACYPQPEQFSRHVSAVDYRQALEDSNRLPIPADLSLHIELPANWSALQTEMALVSRHLDADRHVRALSLQCNQTRLPPLLFDHLHQHFDLSLLHSVTLACELCADNLPNFAQLHERGITRLSLITPCQRSPLLEASLAMARDQGIEDIHLDVVYGLPDQSPADCLAGFDQVLKLAPQSLMLLSGHHLPARVRRLMAQPPSLGRHHSRAAHTLRRSGLTAALNQGYRYIGLDCLAHADSPMATARDQGRLQRSMQGYRVSDERLDQLGLGPAALSLVGDCLVENQVRSALWERDLAKGRLPIRRGLIRDLDNRVRALVIDRLLSDAQVSFQHCERLFQFSFQRYFAQALHSLRTMATSLPQPGLHIDEHQIRVDSTALSLLPQIAAAFDRYAQDQQPLSHIG